MNCIFLSGQRRQRRSHQQQANQRYSRAVGGWTTGSSGGNLPQNSWDKPPSLLPRHRPKNSTPHPPQKHAKITAHPKSFAAKSIIIITCGDEFPLMVAGPQQPPLIMTFCSCWQSLAVRWLVPNSQRVRQTERARAHARTTSGPDPVPQTRRLLERQACYLGRPRRFIPSACSFETNHM